MSGRSKFLYSCATTPVSKKHERSIIEGEAREFRVRLDRLFDQLSQDQASPYAVYLPMLGALMASMDDGALLDLRDLLRTIVGDE